MLVKNKEIRERAKNAGVFLWQVADALGMPDHSLSRRLRKELPKEQAARIMEVIDSLSKEAANE